MKVQNMVSQRGNSIPNQFVITDGNMEYFQSYKTIVAKKDYTAGRVTIDKNNPFSKTTSKYLYMFIGSNHKKFNADMKDGKFLIADLNSK